MISEYLGKNFSMTVFSIKSLCVHIHNIILSNRLLYKNIKKQKDND